MDYEAEDRYMSSWVVTCRHNGTRFYLTDEDLATDMLSNARVFRWEDEAREVATSARYGYEWRGEFRWKESRTARELSRKPARKAS